jgi:hypothetical protein
MGRRASKPGTRNSKATFIDPVTVTSAGLLASRIRLGLADWYRMSTLWPGDNDAPQTCASILWAEEGESICDCRVFPAAGWQTVSWKKYRLEDQPEFLNPRRSISWVLPTSVGRTAWDGLRFGARRSAGACGPSFDASSRSSASECTTPSPRPASGSNRSCEATSTITRCPVTRLA